MLVNAATSRLAAIEVAVNFHRDREAGLVSIGAVHPPPAATVGGAGVTERDAIMAWAIGVCDAAHLKWKEGSVSCCRSVPCIVCQYAGVILIGLSLSSTHPRASGDQQAILYLPLASSSRMTNVPSLGAVSMKRRIRRPF